MDRIRAIPGLLIVIVLLLLAVGVRSTTTWASLVALLGGTFLVTQILERLSRLRGNGELTRLLRSGGFAAFQREPMKNGSDVRDAAASPLLEALRSGGFSLFRADDQARKRGRTFD